ncbi:hypothetical protein llap_9174 [Limosa lapponica baueri]|uniref:Ig-like domain-containing protein n=1 Tax=Limosa lapponica baueri TaxID=1758121 RepID=A0A2I0U3C2_LIMLA|nr:hypothetical protein llap_9174 [Limosa lapponica baueri]
MAPTWAVLAALLFVLINLVEGPAYNMVNVEAGHEAVLSCPDVSNVPFVMVMWKTKCSACCLLAYRRDRNETRKLNCSERMMWKYPPDSNPALRIYPVNLGDEGNYSCEIANDAGNFLLFSSLTVIGICDSLELLTTRVCITSKLPTGGNYCSGPVSSANSIVISKEEDEISQAVGLCPC